MAWYKCLGTGGGGSGANKVLGNVVIPECFDSSASQSDYNRITLSYDNMAGTDVEQEIFSYTATEKCNMYLPNWSRIITDTGSTEGYIKITVNGTQKYKKYLLSSMAENVLSDIPTETKLNVGDVFKIIVGFDNSHSQCDFYMQTYPFAVSLNTINVLENGQVSSASPGSYLTANFNDISGLEYVIVELYDTYSGTDYIDRTAVKVSDIPASGYLALTFHLDSNSSNIAVTLTRTSISVTSYSGNWKDIYANVFVNVGETGGGGVTQPTKFWQGLQSQYDALISHESDRMYTIVATIGQMSDTMGGYINKTSKIYIGDTLIYPVEEQGYDWCITDYFLPDSNASTNGDNRDYDMNVGVYFQSDANKNRDWQIEFKATLSTGSYSSSDQVIFGQGNNSNARLKEVYFNTSGDLYIAGNSISDTDYISDANGHDIKMIYSNANGTIELYKDGTLVNTITGVPTSYSAANYELGLCRYKSSYRFHGTINYFKFKWLS